MLIRGELIAASPSPCTTKALESGHVPLLSDVFQCHLSPSSFDDQRGLHLILVRYYSSTTYQEILTGKLSWAVVESDMVMQLLGVD